jgi:hypothetical protein
MERLAMEQLNKRKKKKNKNKKPLIIRGARQVGKTWLMKTLDRKPIVTLFISILLIIRF